MDEDREKALLEQLAALTASQAALTAAISALTSARAESPAWAGTVSELLELYAASWPRDATWKVSRRATLAPAAKHFGDRPAHSLTRQDWVYWRDKIRAETRTARKRKPEATTLNMEVAYWRHAHRWAIEEGLLRENPLERIKPLPAKKHRQTEPSSADIEALREHLDAEGWAYVMLGQRRGLRACEARKLEWQHIDLDRGRVRFTAAKSRKWTEVAIPSDVVEALRAIRPQLPGRYVFQSPRRPNQPVDATTLWRKFRYAADAAGLVAAEGDRCVVFHDTRHGFTSQMARRLPLKTAMRLSRHESLRSASRYIHVNEEDLEEAHEVLEHPARKPARRSDGPGHPANDAAKRKL